MAQEHTLNPQIVHDAAACLFWALAEKRGVAATNNDVIESNGWCLLNQSFAQGVLSQYNLAAIPATGQQEFKKAIASEAYKFASNEENMNGIIYAEDAQLGRSPSAANVNTNSLKAIPKLNYAEGIIEKVGSLCLRHPLPAVVFSPTCPSGNIIEVADTNAALGYHLPMLLTGFDCQQISDEQYVLTGIFQIPVPDTSCGGLWNKAIQNSSRFVSEIKLIGPDPATIDVIW